MRLAGALEVVSFNESCSKRKSCQTTLAFVTFFLWVSPALANEGTYSECVGEEYEFCSSPCERVYGKCHEDRDCTLELCSYLYPVCHPQANCPGFLHACWESVLGCSDASQSDLHSHTVHPYNGNIGKRNILNKNVAYLLLKLHPFLNQTSQFGFLTSGRFRRITGNFGTEFLGKRSNNKPTGSRNPKPTPSTPRFYSLPLNKLAQTRILRRDEEFPFEKRSNFRRNGKVVLGSEFLGKRSNEEWERLRRFAGTELLGKRDSGILDGSEFLGKRTLGLFPRNRDEEEVETGSELLGKKSNNEKRYGNEMLGKRYIGNELLGKKSAGFTSKESSDGMWTDYDPELIDEAFYNYRSFHNAKPETPEGVDCDKSGFKGCTGSKGKEKVKGEREQATADSD